MKNKLEKRIFRGKEMKKQEIKRAEIALKL
jgi:hypothetical protein